MEQVQLGLRQNWKQFVLLIFINAFVGGMVGLERTILPQLAEDEFQIAAKSAIFSFIIVFGITKALTNYFTGSLADRFGRKRLLIAGWLFALPVPLMLMYAPSWSWVIAANVLLGINQGLAWSSTVVMKIDLAGSKHRGLAMGLNESAGYLAVGAAAFFTGWIAVEYGIRPYPFYLGIGFALIGLLNSWLFVKDTARHVKAESKSIKQSKQDKLFWKTTWKDPNLGSVTQAGLVNNLNDGLMWGTLPLLMSAKGFDLGQIAQVAATYPAVWGLGQLITGKMSDHLEKKKMLFWGMSLQGFALFLMIFSQELWQFTTLAVFLGAGTALVYPTFLASIAENSHPVQRAGSIGIFRLWRDMGYAFGALLTGIVADWLNIDWAVGLTAVLTLFSALIIQVRMNVAAATELPKSEPLQKVG
jgi:MFS family permease